MDRPKGVDQAILLLWVVIGISTIAALISKWMGLVGMDEFFIMIFVYGLFCIFPYKISKGSNASRYVLAVLTVASIILLLGGLGEGMSKVDFAAGIFVTPIELFILYRLFEKSSSEWFTSSNKLQTS